MVDKEQLEELQEKIEQEITNIKEVLQNEIENGTEEMTYRNAKIYVFAKSIQSNLENFLLYMEEKNENIGGFLNTFLYKENIIEEIYIYLYEKNGTKYDLFLDRVELLESIIFFINHN